MQWEDAADEEEDWETAEADLPDRVSGAAGSFDVEATEEPGQSDTAVADVFIHHTYVPQGSGGFNSE